VGYYLADASTPIRAGPDHGMPSMGFCYLNNKSLAAEQPRKLRQGRIAIIDIDVPNGNGTRGIAAHKDLRKRRLPAR
jgi:acetoin utilization deacetylase AcuC-like enzyme